MSNEVLSTLKVYGNRVHADTARKIVEAVFGSCVPNEENRFFQTENPPPLAVVRIRSTDVPPTTLVEELSTKLPDLSFMLIYAIPIAGHRGHVQFVAGNATDEYAERYLIEEELRVEGNGTVAGKPGHVVSLTTIREIARERFDRGYSYVYEEIFHGCITSWSDQATKGKYFDDYALLKSLLGAEGEEYFTRLQQHHMARAERLAARSKARDALKTALERLEAPEITPLLDADDRDVLTRAATMLVKIEPDFRSELATTFE